MPWLQKQDATRFLREFVYGESGTGKTVLALMHPGVGLIPFERGHIHYRDDPAIPDFIEFEPKDGKWTFAELIAEIKKLKDPKNIPTIKSSGIKMQTLVIDTIGGVLAGVEGVLIEEQMDLVTRSSRANKADLTFKDWGEMKRKYSQLMYALDGLEMNVVVIARLHKDIDTKMMIEFADKNTKYYFDMVYEVKHTTGEHRKVIIQKDRTKHYKRHQAISIPDNEDAWEKFLKPIFDDLQAGKVKSLKAEYGGIRVEEKEQPKKAEKPKKAAKKQPSKKADKTKPAKKKGLLKGAAPTHIIEDEAKDFTKSTIVVDGKEIPYMKPENAEDKRKFLTKIFNNKKHPLRSKLNKMVGGSPAGLLPENADAEDIDAIWDLLIDKNKKITTKK